MPKQKPTKQKKLAKPAKQAEGEAGQDHQGAEAVKEQEAD